MKFSTVKFFAIAAVTALAVSVTPTAKGDDKGCNNAILLGTFAYTSTGFAMTPGATAGPFAETGTQVFDGKGGVTATVMASQDGNVLPLSMTGTYTVFPDCTGTMRLQVVTATPSGPQLSSPVGLPVSFYFVIADIVDGSANAFQAVDTDLGLVVTRIGRRLFPGRTL